LSNA